jgi:hypothetical protein
MSLLTYPVVRIDGKLTFYFVSKNPFSGNPIYKVVTYGPLIRYGVVYYSLGFGDYDEITGLSNDKAISNNGDMRKILGTVVSTLKIFFSEHPYEVVHIEGSDQTRKDYYHKLINDYWYNIQELYLVEGCNNGVVEVFQKGMKYEFILISLKKS